MMQEEIEKKLRRLREPFEPAQVGKLPRSTCKDCSERRCQKHQKQRCNDCGNYMTTAHIHLDYVGHAAVTDRLLEVDPGWWWEPMGLDESGTPDVDVDLDSKERSLWIKLHVLGVTRVGVGIVPKGSFESNKQLISDAIRNAAMRFGVALDLWSKEDISQPTPEPVLEPTVDLVEFVKTTVPAAVQASLKANWPFAFRAGEVPASREGEVREFVLGWVEQFDVETGEITPSDSNAQERSDGGAVARSWTKQEITDWLVDTFIESGLAEQPARKRVKELWASSGYEASDTFNEEERSILDTMAQRKITTSLQPAGSST